MLKIVQQLCDGTKTSGNYHSTWSETTDTENKDHYLYHGNCVCTVDHCMLTFKLNDCRYTGSGIARILDSYREYWTKEGYTEAIKEKGGKMGNKRGKCVFFAQDHHNHGISEKVDAERLVESVLEDRYEDKEEVESITINQSASSWIINELDHDYLVLTDPEADYTAVYELVKDDKKDEMFNVSFSTTGACFGEYKEYEISKILTKLSMRVYEGETGGTVKDTNGNTIGKWGLNDEE